MDIKRLFRSLRRHHLAQRLRYEIIYSWPGWSDCSTFNVGYWPLDTEIAADPSVVAEPNQIQLYAELMKASPIAPCTWRECSVLEVAAGRGGGLAFIKRTFSPATAVGLDISRSAASHARRRLGIDVRIGAAHHLPFSKAEFDIVLSLDALVHLDGRERIVAEIARVLKPSGCYLVGDFILASIEGARRTIDDLANAAGFQVQTFRDITRNVVQSIKHDHDRKSRLISRLPPFIRAGLAETMTLRGSRRYVEWQSGRRSYFLAALARPTSDLPSIEA